MGDLVPMRAGLEEILADLERLKHGRAPTGQPPAPAPIQWPAAWGPEHVALGVEAVKRDHATMDLVRARGLAPWAACALCVDGWVGSENIIGQAFQTPCKCRGLRLLVERIDRAEFPAEVALKDWRLETIDWRTIEAAEGAAKLRTEDGVRVVQVRAAVEEFVTGWRRGRPGLIFQGSNGIGKSHIAAGIGRALIFAGVNARWLSWADYLARIRATFGDERPNAEDNARRPFVEAELLVLEELGAGKWSEWVGGQAEELIYQRHSAGRTTVVTTNLTLTGDGPGSLVAYIGERARSRLLGACEAVRVLGADWRTKHLAGGGR